MYGVQPRRANVLAVKWSARLPALPTPVHTIANALQRHEPRHTSPRTAGSRLLLKTVHGDDMYEGLYGDGLDLPEPEDEGPSPPPLPALEAESPSPSPDSSSPVIGIYGEPDAAEPGGYGSPDEYAHPAEPTSRDMPPSPSYSPNPSHLHDDDDSVPAAAPLAAEVPAIDDMQDMAPAPAPGYGDEPLSAPVMAPAPAR